MKPCFFLLHAWCCLWKFANQNTPQNGPSIAAQRERTDQQPTRTRALRWLCGASGGALEARWWVHRPGRSRIRWKPHISSS